MSEIHNSPPPYKMPFDQFLMYQQGYQAGEEDASRLCAPENLLGWNSAAYFNGYVRRATDLKEKFERIYKTDATDLSLSSFAGVRESTIFGYNYVVAPEHSYLKLITKELDGMKVLNVDALRGYQRKQFVLKFNEFMNDYQNVVYLSMRENTRSDLEAAISKRTDLFSDSDSLGVRYGLEKAEDTWEYSDQALWYFDGRTARTIQETDDHPLLVEAYKSGHDDYMVMRSFNFGQPLWYHLGYMEARSQTVRILPKGLPAEDMINYEEGVKQAEFEKNDTKEPSLDSVEPDEPVETKVTYASPDSEISLLRAEIYDLKQKLDSVITLLCDNNK